MDDEELDPTEAARIRRRDRDLAAEDRALMDNGAAKWFKQALDAQARAARDDARERPAAGASPRTRPGPEARPKAPGRRRAR